MGYSILEILLHMNLLLCKGLTSRIGRPQFQVRANEKTGYHRILYPSSSANVTRVLKETVTSSSE